MPSPNRKDASPLYPTPKTYDELVAEQDQRKINRRPHFVAEKISTWLTLGALTIVLSYQAISRVMAAGIASADFAILGASASILLGLVALTVLIYLYVLTAHLIEKVFVSTATIHVILITLLTITSLALIALTSHKLSTIVIIFAVLLCQFLVTYPIISFAIKQQSNDN